VHGQFRFDDKATIYLADFLNDKGCVPNKAELNNPVSGYVAAPAHYMSHRGILNGEAALKYGSFRA
jgi:hypothetical protein